MFMRLDVNESYRFHERDTFSKTDEAISKRDYNFEITSFE
jgi:hypothetical protein